MDRKNVKRNEGMHTIRLFLINYGVSLLKIIVSCLGLLRMLDIGLRHWIL